MVSDDRELQARLRASLHEHARQAPDAYPVTERILAAAGGRPAGRARRARHWRTWSLPLVAAASVAAVVVALIGVGAWNPGGHGRPAADASHAVGSQTVAATHRPATSPAPARSAATTPHAPQGSSHAATANTDTSGLSGFRVVDMTFVAGGEHGWALGTAACLNGKPGRCAAMVRTTDGGTSWHSLAPPAQVSATGSCTQPCVSHLRFANDEVGYAYGPEAVFMTTDGGGHWKRLSAHGSLALEIAGGNLVSVSTECRPGCPYQVWTATVGKPDWKRGRQIEGGMSPGVSLARSGTLVVLAVYGHTTGGTRSAPTALWVSGDDGRHWSDRGEPCPQHMPDTGEMDATRLAVGEDGSVTVLCTPRRAGTGSQVVLTSTDSARTFERWNVHSLGRAPGTALASSSAKLVLVALGEAVYRSTDGHGFVKLSGAHAPGAVSWLGFENAHDARAVSADGRTIWTSHDGGATWRAYTFR